MAGEALNVRGPCSSCGAQLATDQRYCVECGHRVGPPLALPYALPAGAAGATAAASRSGFVLPVPIQTVSTFAALALGFGFVVGTAISPNLGGIIAAPSPTVVAQAPPPDNTTTPTPATGGGGGVGSAPVVAPAPTTVASTPTSSGAVVVAGVAVEAARRRRRRDPPLEFTGTVVRVNAIAQSYTLASNGGLISIHGNTLPQVGDQVKSPVRKLSNGTYAEQGNRAVQGQATSANFLGTVTSCADLEHRSTPCSGTPPSTDHFVYSVSSVGASVMVSSPPAAPLPVSRGPGSGRSEYRRRLHSHRSRADHRLHSIRCALQSGGHRAEWGSRPAADDGQPDPDLAECHRTADNGPDRGSGPADGLHPERTGRFQRRHSRGGP